jgi:hypothetical protein
MPPTRMVYDHLHIPQQLWVTEPAAAFLRLPTAQRPELREGDDYSSESLSSDSLAVLLRLKDSCLWAWYPCVRAVPPNDNVLYAITVGDRNPFDSRPNAEQR